ncbi:MAG: N-acetylmuramoyl-L-alanine amidase [Armatimonadota bacterium]
MIRRLLICALVLLLPLFALADTLVVAGRAQQLTSPLIVDGTEVLAPAAAALRVLGVTVKQQHGVITLATSDGRAIKLKLNSTVGEVDGRKFTVSAVPREVDGALYLPMTTLAPYLDTHARYQREAKSLTLLPLLHISYANGDDGSVTVLARSVAPLQYTSGWLKDPARAYFDFKAVSLGNDETRLAPGVAGIERIRMSQYSTNPDVARVVVDCDVVRHVNATVGEQGRLVTLTIGAHAPAAVQPSPEPQPGGGQLKLLDATLESLSPQQSHLTLAAAGMPQVTSLYDPAKRQLSLQIDGTVNAIPAERLKELGDRQIESVSVETPTGGDSSTVTVTLKRDTGYLVHRDVDGIHVMIGTFGISDMLIVLDAGHGGHDTGAVGAKGTCEKDINLDIIQRAGKVLSAAGARVLYTRSDDTFIPLDNRPGLANSRKADIFISVHCNSTPTRNSASGTQTYFKTPQSIPLASAMHEELVKAIELRDGGIRAANFLVIRKSQMPSVLLEIAFINNAKEEQLLCTPAFRDKVAQGILNGVRRYATSDHWKLRRANLTNEVAEETGVVLTAVK